jgi:hypothetical protein
MNFKDVEVYEERRLRVDDFRPYFLGGDEKFIFSKKFYRCIEEMMVDWCETWNFREGLIDFSVLQIGREMPTFDFEIYSEIENP